jgi:DNA-binding response OmpR family regulator
MFPLQSSGRSVESGNGNPRLSASPPHNRLTRKEAELLAMLRRNAGHCLSRDYLLRTIWGFEGPGRTRTLDVHIQRLRRKLGPKDGANILTIFRTGYCWRPSDESALI